MSRYPARQDQAKEETLRLWPEWAQENNVPVEGAEGEHGIRFYNFLGEHHPDCLRFQYNGDRWQVVHGWLMNSFRMS